MASFWGSEAPSSLPSPLGKAGHAAALGCSRKRHTCDDRPTYLSYRHCPIRLAPLATFPTRGRLCVGGSGTLVNGVLETISLALFHPAFPIQPPPLRGTSFHRKECPREPLPLDGAAERSEAGLASFGALVNCRLWTHFPLFFIPLEPYPARFARHLPLEGKALSVVILFLHVSCIRFDDTRIPSSKKGGEAATRALNLKP